MSTPTPFFTVPFVTPNPLGAVLDGSKVTPAFNSTAEALAQAHWLFGSDNPGMTDLIAGAAATIAGGSPTLSSGYMTPPTGAVASYVNSGIADAAAQTLAGCIQWKNATGAKPWMGAWHNGGGVGSILYNNAGAAAVLTVGATGQTPAPAPPSTTDGTWLFAAKVSSAAGETVYWGNGTSLLSYVYSTAKTLDATKNVGFAGSFDGVFGDNPSAIAEGMVFAQSLTAFQVLGIYMRSKARLTARGLTLS